MTAAPAVRTLLALALLALASAAQAQTATATKWELRFYQGGTSPTSTQVMLLADTTCNLPPTAPPQPTWSVRWEQPPTQGTCQWISPPGGVLQSRPVGVAYTVGLVAINNDTDGPGPESARINFRLPAIPAVPTGLALRSGQ